MMTAIATATVGQRCGAIDRCCHQLRPTAAPEKVRGEGGNNDNSILYNGNHKHKKHITCLISPWLHCIAASNARSANPSNTNLIFMGVMCHCVGRMDGLIKWMDTKTCTTM